MPSETYLSIYNKILPVLVLRIDLSICLINHRCVCSSIDVHIYLMSPTIVSLPLSLHWLPDPAVSRQAGKYGRLHRVTSQARAASLEIALNWKVIGTLGQWKLCQKVESKEKLVGPQTGQKVKLCVNEDGREEMGANPPPVLYPWLLLQIRLSPSHLPPPPTPYPSFGCCLRPWALSSSPSFSCLAVCLVSQAPSTPSSSPTTLPLPQVRQWQDLSLHCMFTCMTHMYTSHVHVTITLHIVLRTSCCLNPRCLQGGESARWCFRMCVVLMCMCVCPCVLAHADCLGNLSNGEINHVCVKWSAGCHGNNPLWPPNNKSQQVTAWRLCYYTTWLPSVLQATYLSAECDGDIMTACNPCFYRLTFNSLIILVLNIFFRICLSLT